MSDALPIPPRPDLDQYTKLAKDLQLACRSGSPARIRDWAESWLEMLDLLRGEMIAPDVIGRCAERLVRQWESLRQSNDGVARCALAGARLFIAQSHGFATWASFTRHLEALIRVGSSVAAFERAADAIVSGDLATLEKLLREDPGLVRARSTRAHRSTLLHYVSANGIEDFRQKTPPNIVGIARLLLDAGADVNADSNAYGGRCTTLGLTATSCHPEAAGVQIPLMQLLICRGAAIDAPDGGSAVVACLRNGRGVAAEFLANRGARLDLEAAAGVGRLDIVRGLMRGGSRKPSATPVQVRDGFAWACEFGRTAVADFLLRRGMDVDRKLPHDGQTGLHWAAYGGHADTVKLLLERGAPVHARDDSYHASPLEWALYAWGNAPDTADRGRYYDVVALLVRAGATLDSSWSKENAGDRGGAVQKLWSDPRMQAELGPAMLR
ncbi:MAG: ankyrin repeat domain-containing protein [Bryobacteraceae bacterium]|nr:ankyrin repeat domain-containing protein [Bryobacteraceae bacterium]